jgi:very-long-chain enoyl-CoA reductase
LGNGDKLYLKDLGPQISWQANYLVNQIIFWFSNQYIIYRTAVFLAEYAGPLLVYVWIYQRPWLFYGDSSSAEYSQTAQ